MEVHTHAHNAVPDPSTNSGHRGRKRWTHYFWEFLMLFLAVFAGFLAENKREHVVEHQREKVYASNMYEELKKDTFQLNAIITEEDSIVKRLDTLCMLIREKNSGSVTPGMLYYYANKVTNVNYFASRNTTVEQLKGSGNLRIMGQDLSYQISEYDRLIRQLEKEYGLSNTEFAKLEDVHFRVFDLYLMEEIFGNDKRADRDSLFAVKNFYVNSNPDLLREYIGWVKFEANIYRFQTKTYLDPLRKAAVQLLKTLQTKYHLN